MKIVLEGEGILSGPFDGAEIDRQLAEERRREQEAAARERELQAQYDSIDAHLAPLLKAELEAETATERVTSRIKKDFAKFRSYCQENALPFLPADARPVAEWLGSQIESGAAHVSRLARAVSVVHTSVGLPDPTTDILVRAVLRLARTEANNSPQTKDLN
jgi:hypothetical protein